MKDEAKEGEWNHMVDGMNIRAQHRGLKLC